MRTKLLLIAIFVCWRSSSVSGARILALFPYIGKSHFVAFEPLVKELAARGHQLVVVSHFLQKHPVANYTDISLVGSLDIDTGNRIDIASISGLSGLYTIVKEVKQFFESCNNMLSFHTVQELIKSDLEFDLILSETFFTDCFIPFVDKFKVPNIAISSTVLLPWSYDRMGNPDNPAYIPNLLAPVSHKMSFVERLGNTLTNVVIRYFFYIVEGLVTEHAVRQNFGSGVPSLSELARNTSLVLVNTHFSLNSGRPLVPGIIEVGGMHLQTPKKLPKDFEDYLNEAEQGVILFSLGSMLRTDTLPTDKKEALLQAFSELPQRVLWKWESNKTSSQPKNVKTVKWLPQFDALNHPNVLLFIGHGGMLGITEAVCAGVPMVGIPMFGDQFTNVKAMEASGMGISLQFADITKDNVVRIIRTILDNPSYRENARKMSKIYLDRPMSPMDTAIYWVEYVIRHKGAPHLRTAAVDLAWYQYLLLDVIAFFVFCVMSVLFITYKIITKLKRIIFTDTKIKSKLH